MRRQCKMNNTILYRGAKSVWLLWFTETLLRIATHNKYYMTVSINQVGNIVWKYQRGNQNPLIEGKDNTLAKRTNNHLQNITQKNNDRETRNPLKIGGELGCSGGVGSSCSTSGTRRYSSYKSGDKSWMRKDPGSIYDKWDIFVIICDTNLP
jgi:hypothetical protein